MRTTFPTAKFKFPILAALILTCLMTSLSHGDTEQWQNSGPNGRSVALSPNFAVDHIIFAGSATGGILKSSDGGTSWIPANNGLSNMNIWAIAVSTAFPSDHTVFAGTDGGVFRSPDDGYSWTPVYNGIGPQSIHALALSPEYPNDQTIFAGTWGGGLYKSTDGGANWNLSGSGISEPYIPSIAFSPAYAVDRTIFAGTWNSGVFKSTDGGTTWNSVGITYNHTIHALAVSPGYAADQTVYVGIGGGGGVMKSTNGGAIWQPVNNGLNNLNILSMAISPGYAYDPTPPVYPGDDTLYVGTFGGGVFRSSDRGVSWIPVNNGLNNLNAWSMAISPAYRNDLTVFAGTDTGLFKLASPSAAPVVSVNPTGLSFGDQFINSSSTEQGVTITNSGGAPLLISSITITDANPAQYAITSYGNCETPSPYLTLGAECTIFIRFSPTTEGVKYATLMVSSNDPNTPIRAVPLYGVGVALSDTTPPFTAASPPAGTYAATQSVTLSASETATIYYTLDGSTPTTASQVYSSPIPISATTTLKFFARDTAGNTEMAKTEYYAISPPSPLTISVTGCGMVNYSIGGACTSKCSQSYNNGTTITLTQAACSDANFVGWSGCDQISGNQCTVTVNAAKSVVATFAPSGGLSTAVWSSAAAMANARFNHTASLLPNGTVLVAGGWNNSVTLSSVELYNPSNNSWSAANPLLTARSDHTATLLPNSKVLVAGGTDNNYQYSSSAEIYDPATSNWSWAGSLATARNDHTATLLPNGKVLVAGGNNLYGALASAELYDPATNIWSSTGSMITARNAHTATLLPNGKVLVTGGNNNGTYLSVAELFDPATSSWSSVEPMADARVYHTATLLANGKVLVAGWTIATAELFDTDSNSWSSAGNLETPRYSHTSTLLPDGNVLVAGGYNYNGSYYANPELYNPSTNSWSSAGLMATKRVGHSATLLANGKVLLTAGNNNGSNLTSSELYTPPVIISDLPYYPLAISLDGNGSVSFTAPAAFQGSGCSASCTRIFADKTVVTVTPTVSAGSLFNGWSGCDTISGNLCTVTIDGTKNIVAHFSQGNAPAKPAIAAGMANTLALKNDGSVWRWGGITIGYGPVPQQITDLADSIAISTGAEHSVAITAEGKVRIWGSNAFGQMGTGLVGPRSEITGLDNITAIAAGHWYTATVRADGTVWSFGENRDGCLGDGTTDVRGDLVQAVGLSGVKALAASHSTLALKTDGTVWSWGKNDFGQLGDGTTIQRNSPAQIPGLSNIVSVASSRTHSLALTELGTVIGWGEGYPQYPQFLTTLSNVVAIAAGDSSSFALKADSTVWEWHGSNTPTEVPGLSGITAISASDHAVALKNDGTIWSWGINDRGQLGDGTLINSTTPVKAASNTTAKHMLTIAVSGNGTVYSSPPPPCNGTCTEWVTAGGELSLSASPDSGYIFIGWSGCDSVAGPTCIVTMSGSKYITATFAPNTPYTLTATRIGSGSGQVTSISPDTRINLTDQASSSAQYTAGSSITLTVSADSGSYFSGWRGACSGTAPCSVQIGGDTEVVAVFTSTTTGNPGPVQLNNQYFTLLQDAYSALLTGSSAVIFANELSIKENLVFDRNITVILKGGYDSSFGSNTGLTVLKGTLTITSGSVIMENIVIQ